MSTAALRSEYTLPGEPLRLILSFYHCGWPIPFQGAGIFLAACHEWFPGNSALQAAANSPAPLQINSGKWAQVIAGALSSKQGNKNQAVKSALIHLKSQCKMNRIREIPYSNAFFNNGKGKVGTALQAGIVIQGKRPSAPPGACPFSKRCSWA